MDSRANIIYQNLDVCDAFAALNRLGKRDTKRYSGREAGRPRPVQLTLPRIAACDIELAAGLRYNYAAKLVDEQIVNALTDLANEQQCIAKYRALAGGAVMNTGERRMVLHHLARGLVVDGGLSEQRQLYDSERQRIAQFAEGVRSGAIGTATGRHFDTVVQIGIGGSDLGPRALYIALQGWCRAEGIAPLLKVHFISNVDPDDAIGVLERIDPQTTLFILVSKSGTTQETLTNEALVVETLRARGIGEPRQQIVAVTAQSSPLAANERYRERFFIDDFIGGRYSSTSAVGGVVLSLAFGPTVFDQLLEGAHQADLTALNPDARTNATLLDALIGVYERNILGIPMSAILPYSQALERFPAHLQQLDMESNGKQVNRDDQPLAYATGPIIFGEPGTNGQHSFYQLLHQGTDIVALQFIGFRNSQLQGDLKVDGVNSQTKLNSNLAAQIVAFAHGHHQPENRNRHFPGGRPASLIYGDRLTPAALGALLAHFENKVMFQGLLWNINSFDQEGVQLGKRLTSSLLAGTAEPALVAMSALLNAD